MSNNNWNNNNNNNNWNSGNPNDNWSNNNNNGNWNNNNNNSNLNNNWNNNNNNNFNNNNFNDNFTNNNNNSNWNNQNNNQNNNYSSSYSDNTGNYNVNYNNNNNFVTSTYNTSSYDNSVHSSSRCDGCSMYPIKGRRYRCTQCKDFDFCQTCFYKNQKRHDHPFVCKTLMKQSTYQTHYNVTCDGCSVNPIIGKRYTCCKCNNLDFCESCYKNNIDCHPHNFDTK